MNDFNQIFNLQYWQEIIQLNLTPWRLFIAFVDIGLITFLIYKALRSVQGTKLMTLVRGVLLFIVLKIVSGWLGLGTFEWLLNQVITYGVIAAVIVFQPEIRRGLESLGRTTNIFIFNSTDDNQKKSSHIKAYEKAVDYMSGRKIGALIVLEQSQNLDEYISTGIKLHAAISAELLINIFIPNTPLHDGAVIIQGDKIAVASAYLPLTENGRIPKEFGTRHRAAIGLSEVSDAITLIVSEETGAISITENGEFHPDLSKSEFHDFLIKNLEESVKPKHRSKILSKLAEKRGKVNEK
ncbi:ABC transporter permease [Lactococcus hodotermopsidis]|uniref:Diadenylate cyclase n=1 Tax=Pseudolactococcus hodotermopsidis TaxID=2709157 RepID=A0A6A0BEY2_9LACT|nr:diadenylate cyclase CdaA [Lactococcus hodotermopsidis]GFH42898.1 ABC transporter permease [Lactococcus hodotermopsidis]